MIFAAAQDRDANRQVIASNEAFVARKTVAFDGTAGKGAQGTSTLFTVTGDVVVLPFGTCTESLAGASATISMGVTGSGTALIGTTTATNIQAGFGWKDSSPLVSETLPTVGIILQAKNILQVVATADITDGTINYYVQWRPLSADGNVVPT